MVFTPKARCFTVFLSLGWHNSANSFAPFHKPTVSVLTSTPVLFAEKVEATQYAMFNFGSVSTRDDVLYTAERPGNPATKTGMALEKDIQAWLTFMKEQKIGHVIALLDDNEFDNYAHPGLCEHYQAAGMECIVQPMRDPEACVNILRYIRTVEQEGGKVVTHCTGGIGRAGRIAAAWLVDRYDLSPETATQEVLEQAAALNINRKGNAELLVAWMNPNVV